MHIFITGGTRGIGQGIVKEFLKLGHEVSFTGTSSSSIEAALKGLEGDYLGVVCDVRDIESIKILKVVEKFSGKGAPLALFSLFAKEDVSLDRFFWFSCSSYNCYFIATKN